MPSPGLAIINPAPLFIEGGLQQAFAIMQVTEQLIFFSPLILCDSGSGVGDVWCGAVLQSALSLECPLPRALPLFASCPPVCPHGPPPLSACRLTEPPPSGTTTVTLSLPDTQLVDLLPDSLTFTTLDWSIPQYVTIIQGESTGLLIREGLPAGRGEASQRASMSHWASMQGGHACIRIRGACKQPDPNLVSAIVHSGECFTRLGS